MKIEEIRDIVRVISKYESSAKAPLTLSELLNDNSKLADFYRITLDDASNDGGAFLKLYGKENNAANNYKSLKSYFVLRAINNITFFDLSKAGRSEHTVAIYKSYKYLFVVHVLLALGSRSGAIYFAKKILKLSEKYELHSVAIDLLDKLQTHALQSGKKKEYLGYTHLLNKKRKVWSCESKIKELEELIRIQFSKSLFIHDKLKAEVRSAVRKAQILLKQGDSYFGRVSYYRLLYIHYQIEGAPVKSAITCSNAIKYMAAKPQMSPASRLAEFGLYKLENYILARDYEKGKKAAHYCGGHLDRGMNLWFTYKEYEFLLMMQTVKFSEAISIYQEVISHERYHSQLLHTREKWDIFGLYVAYIAQFEEVPKQQNRNVNYDKLLLGAGMKKGKTFRSPTYAKDKKGFNVAILVMNILVLLEEDKKDLLVKQEDALSSYRFKYLNQKHSHQSFILFKLIRLMIKNDFDLRKIETKSEEIEKQFRTAKLTSGEIFECIQILPPNWVWNRMKIILST